MKLRLFCKAPISGVFPVGIFNNIHRTFDGIVPKFLMLLALSCMCCPTYAAGGAGATRIFNKALNFLEAWDPELTFTIFYILVAFIMLGYFIKRMAQYRKRTSKEFFLGILSFKGTCGRIEYLLSLVALPIIYTLADIVVELFLSNKTIDTVEKLLDAEEAKYCVWLGLAMFLSSLYIAFSQGAKRCHDLGHSGWFQFIPFYVLWMLLKRGVAYEEESLTH